MANPFNWRHPVYGMNGLMQYAIYGLIVGLVLMVLAIAASAFIPTTNTQMLTLFYYFPLIFTIAGAGYGYFMGVTYSHEKEEKEASPLPIIMLPQASGTQTPIIVVPQQPQQPQAPQIVVVPQAAGQQPVVVVPQQPQQK